MSMYDGKKTIVSANINDRPPQIVEEMIKILGKQRRLPACMPQIKHDAAKWFIAHQEPADEYRDKPERVETKDGSGWKTPYIDRLVSNLRIFLNYTETEQYFISEHIAEGIPWRGDSIKFYSMIIDEHRLMQEDKPKYIDRAVRKMKAVLNQSR